MLSFLLNYLYLPTGQTWRHFAITSFASFFHNTTLFLIRFPTARSAVYESSLARFQGNLFPLRICFF